MSLPRLQRLGVGELLTVVGVLLVPISWTAAGLHHATACPGYFLCDESFIDGLAHTVLITLSPPLALLLFAVGDELRHRR